MADSRSSLKKAQMDLDDMFSGDSVPKNTPKMNNSFIATAMRDINEIVGSEFDEEVEQNDDSE